MDPKPNGAGQSADPDVNKAVPSAPLAGSSPAEQNDASKQAEGSQSAPAPQAGAKAEAEDNIKDFLPQSDEGPEDDSGDDTPNVQKRINKLTAKNKELEEKLKALEQKTAPQEEGRKKYSDDTLKSAIQDAMTSGKPELMADVLFYIREQAKDDLREEYLNTQKAVSSEQQKRQQEWQGVLSHFSQFAAPSAAELYPGSRKDLNVADEKSLLYQVSSELYNKNREKYAVANGMFLATADAFASIVRKRTAARPSAEDSEKLKRQLEREQRKNSFGSGDAEGEGSEEPSPKAPQDKLAAFVNERRKFQSERLRGAGV